MPQFLSKLRMQMWLRVAYLALGNSKSDDEAQDVSQALRGNFRRIVANRLCFHDMGDKMLLHPNLPHFGAQIVFSSTHDPSERQGENLVPEESMSASTRQ
eukprot:1158828-Pelagomonas_calceolata.AAC.4